MSSDPEMQSEKPRKYRLRKLATLAAGGGLAAAAIGASANPALAGERGGRRPAHGHRDEHD